MNLLFFLVATINSCETYSKPLVRINGQEDILDLDEVSSDLRAAIIGMKEGEEKRVSIGSLEFVIELIKADATFETHAASAREDKVLENLF